MIINSNISQRRAKGILNEWLQKQDRSQKKKIMTEAISMVKFSS